MDYPNRLPPPLRVLIVESCNDTSSSLARVLQYWGHETAIARDGPSGLAMALAQRPDVILLDVVLPGLNGWDLSRRLRAAAGQPPPFLVVTSGYCRAEDREQSRLAGCDAHMAKPLDLDVLMRLLAQLHQAKQGMTTTDLVGLITDLGGAAAVVEAIDNPDVQRGRGWNLAHWRYDLVPWGVRFRRDDAEHFGELIVTLNPDREPHAVFVVR